MKDIIKIVKYGEDSGILIKTVSETTEMKQKKKKMVSWYAFWDFRC